MEIPTSKTEHRAVNALEVIIDEHSTMDHQISGNDKEMSWDGYIWLYKKNNGEQTKRNFDSRVPIQVKGHHDPNHKYADKKRINYPVQLVDLKAYATEKGVIYFQIFVDGKNSDLFYSSLYPSRIADYLDEAQKRGNTTTINIPFIKLERDPEKLYIIAKQFSDEATKQGSAYTPLVNDRIKSVDFDKLTEINAFVVGATNPYSALLRLSTGDICFYGKTEGDKYFRPMQWKDNSTFFAGRVVPQNISINSEVFYTQYRCIADSNGNLTLILSPNLVIKLPEGKVNYRVNSTIKEIGLDAKFLLKLKETNSFEIHGDKINFSNPKYTPEFETKLQYISDLYDTLMMIDFDVNTRITDYSDKQQNQFAHLVDIRLGKYNNKFQEDFCRYNWKFDDKYYPLLISKKDGQAELSSSLYTRQYAIFLPSKTATKQAGHRMPLFLANDTCVLSNLYYCNYSAFYQQIDESEINDETANALVEGSLRLISVYDQNQDKRFLDLADYLLDKVEQYVQEELVLLNKMQIKKRRIGLNSEDLSAIESIESCEIPVMFGKNVLIGNKQQAEMYFDKLTKEEKEAYKQFPIYELFRQLQASR